MLYLASTSPRRRSLLLAAAIEHRLIVPGPEPVGEGTPAALARCRARGKAMVDAAAILGSEGDAMVLAVDTVVDLAGRECGKPANRAAAAEMLRSLAGHKHLVHSAICLRRIAASGKDTFWEECATSRVCCDPLSGHQLESYLDTGDWQGKAGAYGIQGAAGQFMHLQGGTLDTVIGLPIDLLVALLAAAVPGRDGGSV